MTVRVDFTVSADDFVLGRILTEDPHTRVTLNRMVPLGDRIIPYLWMSSTDLDRSEAMLRSDPDINAFEVVDSIKGEELIRVEWDADFDGLFDAILDSDGVLVEAESSGQEWVLHVRLPDHAHLSECYDACLERGIDIEIKSVHDPGAAAGSDLSLTDTQLETLRAAFEKGYFSVPREIELAELAAEFGISESAVSQRLRRGISALLGEVLSDRTS